MNFKIPKNNGRYLWTFHVVEKMKQYGLSEQKIRSIVNFPERREEGIAPDTVAVMKSSGSAKNPSEIWVMFQIVKSLKKEKISGERNIKKIRIISAWRYPGKSPKDQMPIIPEDVWKVIFNSDFDNC